MLRVLLQLKLTIYYAIICALPALPIIWAESLFWKIVWYGFWLIFCFQLGRFEQGSKILWSMTLVFYGPIAFETFNLKSAWWVIPFGILPCFAVITLWQQIKLRVGVDLFIRERQPQ